MLLSACGGSTPPSAPPPPAVRTAKVTVRTVPRKLLFLGRAESARSVALRALVDGRIVSVAAADGADLSAGTVVFRLGGARVASRRKAYRTAIRQAEAGLAAVEKRVEQARRRAAAHLAAPGESAAAEKAEAEVQTMLAEARSRSERFENALVVPAPVSGKFVDRQVSPGQDVMAGEELGEVLEPEAIRIAAQVVPVPGLSPAPGQAAEISGPADRPMSAVVDAVRPEAGAAGTVQVWLTGDALRTLAPGTAVHGWIVADLHEGAITVPEGAVVRDRSDAALVFTGSLAPYQRTQVSTGEEGEGWIEITAGLEPGMDVVVEGAYGLYWADFAEDFKVED